MESIRRTLATYRDDARASVVFTKSHLDAFSLTRQKKREEKALKVAYRELGDKAAEEQAAEERQSFGSAKESRERYDSLEAALAERKKEEDEARDVHRERARIRGEEIGAVDGEYRRLADAHGTAKAELARLVRAVRDLDDELERPPEKRKTGRSEEDLRTERDSLLPGRDQAREAEGAARAERDAKKEELDGERRAWKEEEHGLLDVVKTAVAARTEAERELATAKSELDGSLEDLGKSVALAGMTAPALAEPLAKAKEHMRSIQELSEEIGRKQAEAASVRKEATRFSLVTGGILVFLVVLVAVISSPGGDEGQGEPAGEAATTSGRAGSPPEPGPGSGGGGAAVRGDLPEEVREAVLALLSLEERRDGEDVVFRPAGEPVVTASEPAAGGATKLSLDVPAESRPSGAADFVPLTVHVRAVVDALGRVLAVRSVGVTDADDEELDRLLEETR